MHVCVFCGSNAGKNPAFRAAASALGERLARDGHVVVYGGASVGLMGALADAALGAGGRVIGIIPRILHERSHEIAQRNLSELVVVETLHERKAAMSARSQAFVAMPGGFGTLDELFEILTWAQLGLHRSPIVLLNVAGFFDPLREMVDKTIASGFIREEHRELFVIVDRVDDLPGALAAFEAPALPVKWSGRDRA